MARILLSIIFGIVFPVVCFMTIGIATDYIQPSILTEIRMFGQPASGSFARAFLDSDTR